MEDFFSSSLLADLHQEREAAFTLSESVGLLELVLSRLYDLKLTPVQPEKGETWHDMVVKVLVEHPEEGLLGVIYLDLFHRPGKHNHPAHYTIQTGRHQAEPCPLSGKLYQTPIGALVCNFHGQDPQVGFPRQIQLGELKTLFHEFGMCMLEPLVKSWWADSPLGR